MHTTNRYIRRVEKIFKKLPKPIEWLSFLHHDLPILIDFSDEIQKLAIQNSLSRAQILALETLKTVSLFFLSLARSRGVEHHWHLVLLIAACDRLIKKFKYLKQFLREHAPLLDMGHLGLYDFFGAF
jgi:hypothetical protein